MTQNDRDVSVKGYYYNLEKSPYEWVSPYGDIYKMPSRKRLEMMEARTQEELKRVDKVLARNNLKDRLPHDIVVFVRRCCIDAVYRQIVE